MSLRASLSPSLRRFFATLALVVAALFSTTFFTPGVTADQTSLRQLPLEKPTLPDVQPAPQLAPAPVVPAVADGCGAESFGAWDVPSRAPGPFARETVNFSVRLKDEVTALRVMSFLAAPGEDVELQARFADAQGDFVACAHGGELARQSAEAWRWRAPTEPGLYHLYVQDRQAGEAMRLNAFVTTPYHGQDSLRGYRIGHYEQMPLRNDPGYRRPAGLVEVTPEMLETWLSPHFQLRQFMCKQDGPWPKYMIVSPRLLLKLETLLAEVNARGIETDTFAVLSGYRTPHYNAAIGNTTRYSRHLYGDAADIYIDRNGDGSMDDIDRNGRVDTGDSVLLAKIVEDHLEPEPRFVGGLGIYSPKPHRGPFIHVDTRGFKARW